MRVRLRLVASALVLMLLSASTPVQAASTGIFITSVTSSTQHIKDNPTFTVKGYNLPALTYSDRPSGGGSNYFNFSISYPGCGFGHSGWGYGINLIKNTATELVFSVPNGNNPSGYAACAPSKYTGTLSLELTSPSVTSNGTNIVAVLDTFAGKPLYINSKVAGLTSNFTLAKLNLSWQGLSSYPSDIAGYNVYVNGVKYNSSLVVSTNVDYSGASNGKLDVQVQAVTLSGIELPLSDTLSITAVNLFQGMNHINKGLIVASPTTQFYDMTKLLPLGYEKLSK